MGDKTRGIYPKFVVTRTDGASEPGGKHADCGYWVCDATHDPFAIPAIRAYADACRAEYPLLAADLDRWLDELDPRACAAVKAPPKLGPCDHRYMTSGQHVEGVKDERVEVCVKCGDQK